MTSIANVAASVLLMLLAFYFSIAALGGSVVGALLAPLLGAFSTIPLANRPELPEVKP